jgi:hypothetical protein
MILICPHDGHAVDEVRASGPNCARHGVPWFTNCPKCRWDWPVLAKDHWMREETDYKGQDFCAECAGVLPKVLLTGRSLESLPPGSQPGSASRAPSGAPGYCSPRSSR